MANESDTTRRRLLEAAGEIFAEKGFQAAKVREICSRAGANLAAVNYYFGDKERLYVEVVRHAHCSGTEGRPTELPLNSPPAERLRQFIRQMLRNVLHQERSAWHAQLMMREFIDPTAACKAVVEADIRPRAEMLRQILDEMLPACVSASDRNLIVFSIVAQCIFFNPQNRFAAFLVGEEEYRSYDLDRLADHIARFTLAALGHDHAGGVAETTGAVSNHPKQTRD